MKTYIRSAVVATVAILAVFAILQVQTLSARGQEATADRIVTAIYRYEEAAKHGTAAEKRMAYDALMSVLRRSEGQ